MKQEIDITHRKGFPVATALIVGGILGVCLLCLAMLVIGGVMGDSDPPELTVPLPTVVYVNPMVEEVSEPTVAPEPTIVPEPTGPLTTFGDGIWRVSTDIEPGTYRTVVEDFGYWARLSGFGGTMDEIITNETSGGGPMMATILPTDAGFESSGCGTWTLVE